MAGIYDLAPADLLPGAMSWDHLDLLVNGHGAELLARLGVLTRMQQSTLLRMTLGGARRKWPEKWPRRTAPRLEHRTTRSAFAGMFGMPQVRYKRGRNSVSEDKMAVRGLPFARFIGHPCSKHASHAGIRIGPFAVERAHAVIASFASVARVRRIGTPGPRMRTTAARSVSWRPLSSRSCAPSQTAR
jgi:hypothetical protein